jgi:hypothetical protein
MFKKLKKEPDPKDAVCLLELSGRNIDMLLTWTEDQKVTVAKKKRPLPDNCYYITSIKKVLEKIDLDKPIRTYILERDRPKNLDFAKKYIDKNGKPIEEPVLYTNDTVDLLLDNNIFTAMFRGLSVSKMQMILYGSLGVVAYEIFGGIITLLIQVLSG